MFCNFVSRSSFDLNLDKSISKVSVESTFILNVISSIRRSIIISFIGKRVELKLGTRLNINFN